MPGLVQSRAWRSAWVAGLSLMWVGTSCGLGDLSVHGITFQLPPQMYALSTSDAQWHAPPAVPDVTCGPGGLVPECCGAAQGLTALGFDCSAYHLSCGDTGHCAYPLPYDVATQVDLATEVAQLKSMQGLVVSSVVLKTIEYTATNNLNVTLPPLDIYVAPVHATSHTDPAARKIAHLAERAVGTSKREIINLDATAQAEFSKFARDLKTPFSILAATTVVITGGDVNPQGRADFTISGTVEARF